MPRTITITIPDEMETFADIELEPIDRVHLRPQRATQSHCAMVAKLARKYGYNFNVCIQLIRSGLRKKDRVILLSMICASNRRFFRDVARLVLGEEADLRFIDSDELMAYTDLEDGADASEVDPDELYDREIKPRDVEITYLKNERDEYKQLVDKMVSASPQPPAPVRPAPAEAEEEDEQVAAELDPEKESPAQKQKRRKKNHDDNEAIIVQYFSQLFDPFIDDKAELLPYTRKVHLSATLDEAVDTHTLDMLQRGKLTTGDIVSNPFAVAVCNTLNHNARPTITTVISHLQKLADRWNAVKKK